MTDNYDMRAPAPTCKQPDVLLAGQAEITVEIDDFGNFILRQQDALGNDADTIIICAANVSEVLEALLDLTPHSQCWYEGGQAPKERSAEPTEGDAADIVGPPPHHVPRRPSSSPQPEAARRKSRPPTAPASEPPRPGRYHQTGPRW